MRPKWVALVSALLLLAFPGAARSGTLSGTLVVDNTPGDKDCPQAEFVSIQEAVAVSQPGQHILVCAGVYNEQVVVTTPHDDISIEAKGAPGTVIMTGEGLPELPGAAFTLTNVSGVLIEGFTIMEYHEAGILLGTPGPPFGVGLPGASNNTIRENDVTDTHHDGIALYNSPGNVIRQNFLHELPSPIACGIQVGFPGSIGNAVFNNVVRRASFGIRLNDGAANNVIHNNDSSFNRRYGILNRTGANGTLISENFTYFNTGTGVPPTEGRGIGITTGSSGVVVENNHSFFNTIDLFWDGTGADAFHNNHCDTSVPPGLCTPDEEEAH